MLLQKIFSPEFSDKTEVFGVELDSDSLLPEFSRPPKNFEIIGFTMKLDNDGTIDENLLDIIISYKLTNIDIVVEVPSQMLFDGKITPKNLIQLANNIDFSISILPPNHPLVGNTVNQEQYVEIIRLFNEELMKKQNFDKTVMPISNFMEYLMLEKLLGIDHPSIANFKPIDPYVQENFVQYMTAEHSNEFKRVLRQSLYDFYGGEKQFDLVASTIFNGILNKTKNVFTEHVKQYAETQKTSPQPPNG